MATTATTTSDENNSNSNNNNVSPEKIQRLKDLFESVSLVQQLITRDNAIPIAAYTYTKSISNLVESIARDMKTTPSELDKIDLKSGRISRRKTKKAVVTDTTKKKTSVPKTTKRRKK